MSINGMYIGAGIALVPVTTTFLIAASRAILINVIANSILMVVTAGSFVITITGLSLIPLPSVIWKISMMSGVVGGTVVALSLTAYLINALYLRTVAKKD